MPRKLITLPSPCATACDSATFVMRMIRGTLRVKACKVRSAALAASILLSVLLDFGPPGVLGSAAISVGIVGWEQGVRGINAADWLAARIPESAIVYRTNSLINQLIAVRAGIGAAVLPCYLGDLESDLIRLFEPVACTKRELWIVTYSELKRTARIRAFFDIVGDALVDDRALVTGSA
ncbi:LysR substrate-binding domain-containing protein [Mesorhizobium sp. KR9-304]|uniref:LysR substrate-binding domain-containing protein n=1 Tax=Mesorhizobium sp. KR9-304 TaxID=3156614 RepID=UPI0032B57C07